MTNLFTRIRNTITADLHEALDQKENKNPIAMLNQYLRECEQETEKVRKLLERQYILKDEFTREYHHAVELADFASAEYQQYHARSSRIQASLDQVNSQLGDLERKYEEMKHKLKDMHLRRMELMGRENVTHANLKINQVLDAQTYSDQSFSRFKEIENYLDRLEHQVNSSFYRNTIDAKIAQLEKEMKLEESKSI
jgi:lia operon protein LiaH